MSWLNMSSKDSLENAKCDFKPMQNLTFSSHMPIPYKKDKKSVKRPIVKASLVSMLLEKQAADFRVTPCCWLTAIIVTLFIQC